MKYGFFLVHSPSVVWSLVRIPALEYIKQKRECSVQETHHLGTEVRTHPKYIIQTISNFYASSLS